MRARGAVWMLGMMAAGACWGQGAKGIEIVEGYAYVTDSGFVRITGELRNRTDRWMVAPRVTVELKDENGKAIASESIATAVSEEQGWGAQEFVYAERTFLPPGEVAVFEFFRDAKKLGGKRYASHTLTVASARDGADAPRMSVEGFATTRDGDVLTARGQLRNAGSASCYSPKVVFGFYDAKGKLMHAESEHPEASFQKQLARGQSVAFEVKLYPDEGYVPADVKAWADCEEQGQ